METIKEMLQNKNELITIISGTSVYERDLVKRVIAKNRDLKSTKVNDVMSTQLVIADINEGYESVLTKMKEAKIRHIIVIEDGKLAGVLSMRDLLEIDIDVHKSTVEVLHNYIYSK